MPLITLSRHPLYTLIDFIKFNLTYEGGRRFIDKYLEKFDRREEKEDFECRKKLTYNPGFAGEALDEVKNGIFQRMTEITRSGGTKSYGRAIAGFDGGVDLEGSNMNFFMGQKALPEVLKFGRTGIYVDMPKFNPYETLSQYSVQPHPYLYVYKAEDILNWRTFYTDNEIVYQSVLLRETHWKFDDTSGLPIEPISRFRLVQLLPQGGVRVTFMEQYADLTSGELKERTTETYDLPTLKRIPFIPLDIGRSLLTDVSDYQIALMNLASSDIHYCITSNFPFYVEGYDPKTAAVNSRQGPMTTFNPETGEETQGPATENSEQEVKVGAHHGRRYPMEAKPPEFINPSGEPITISMAKQKQMLEEIRRLLNLSVSNVAAQSSAESKQMDKGSLEAGLTAIGMKLQLAEKEIANVWAMYEDEPVDSINISYPTTYSLKTDADRLDEAENLNTMKGAVPSRMYQKQIGVRIAQTLLEGRISQKDMQKIIDETMAANYTSGSAADITLDIAAGIVDAVTASNARGYDGETVVPKAQEERQKRIDETAISQTQGGGFGAAQGNKDNPTDTSAKDQKTASQTKQNNPTTDKTVRGPAVNGT